MENNLLNKPINQWAEDDRPREKLISKGRHSLSDAELLAILLRTGNKKNSALDISKDILQRSGNNLIELSRLSIEDFIAFDGIGEAKAVSILAALELGKRRQASRVLQKEKIASSKDVFQIFHSVLSDSYYEEFWLLLLNRANKIIRKVNISEGGISGTVADPKKIFKLAINHHASSIILCHNHPSGNIRPSASDVQLTKKLQEAGLLLDLPVLDHIIIGEDKYFSFADENML